MGEFDAFSPGISSNLVDLQMFDSYQLSDNTIDVTGKFSANGNKVNLQLYENGHNCIICGSPFPHTHAVQGRYTNSDGLFKFDLDAKHAEELIFDISQKSSQQPLLYNGKSDIESPKSDSPSFDLTLKREPNPPLLLQNEQFPVAEEDAKKTTDLGKIEQEEKAKPFKCLDCGRGYASQAAVDNHALAHYGDRPHSCQTCGKSFHLKKLLSQHMMVHTGERPFQCDQCPKTFTRGDRLKSHRQKHAGELPFKCHLCVKSFARKEALLSHIRSHTGSKPWMCEECGRAFSDASNLKAHRNTHSSNKRYICTKCGKKFSRGSHLKTHVMSHDDVWPWECENCQKRFRQKDKLDRHKLIHSDEKPFECSVCQKRYKRKIAVRTKDYRHTHGSTATQITYYKTYAYEGPVV